MRHETPPSKIVYVVKRYPRFSETFIVNEILAHEAAGRLIEIVSLYPPNDTHFQDTLGRVRAPVTYLCAEGLRAADLWTAIEGAGSRHPALWTALSRHGGCSAREIYQAVRLADVLVQRRIEHIHAHFASTATAVARLASLITGIPYTFTAHAKDIFHESVDPADLRRKAGDAAGIITVSDFNVRHLRESVGVPSSVPLHRLYNGIELERFTYESPLERPPTVVAVGRLVEKKGFDVLLDACALLDKEGAAWRCEIVGTGEEGASLAAQVEALGLSDRVVLTGALPQREVIRRVRSAAVMAAPCVVGDDGNADGLPTVLLESMALGTPCVSTPVTGIPELVRHGDTGMLVGQRDAESLAAVLGQLLWDGGLRQRLATNARALIEERFDIRRNAEEQAAIFAGESAGVACRSDWESGVEVAV